MTDHDCTKACRQCEQVFPLTQFKVVDWLPDGRSNYCTPCDEILRERYRSPDWDICKECREWTQDLHSTYKSLCKPCGNKRMIPAWHKRKALKMAAEGSHTASDVEERFVLFGHRCAYCGDEGKLQVDHFQPLARGGSNSKENLVPACQTCNVSKNARWGMDLIVWLAEHPHWAGLSS